MKCCNGISWRPENYLLLNAQKIFHLRLYELISVQHNAWYISGFQQILKLICGIQPENQAWKKEQNLLKVQSIFGAFGSLNFLFNLLLFCFNRFRVCLVRELKKNKLKKLVRSQADDRNRRSMSSRKELEGSVSKSRHFQISFLLLFKCHSRKFSKNRVINKTKVIALL